MIRNPFNFGLVALAVVSMAGVLGGCTGGDSGTSTSTTAQATTTSTTASSATAGSTDASASRPVPTAPGNSVTGDTIEIGVVASITGDNKPWGDDQWAGCQMAADEINAKGGIQGKKVHLTMQDSASKPEAAKTAADLLLSKNVIAIVGEVSSGNTIQIAKSAFEKGVPVIAVGATRTDLTAIGTNVSRVCYTDDFQGPVMAVFAYAKLGLRKMAVMTDNKLPYSQGLSASFIKTFEQLGGKIVGEKFYESGQVQYSGQLTEIKALAPDGMFCSGYFTQVGPIAQQARAAGLTADQVTLLGGDGWDSPTLLTSGGQAILGGYFCNHYNNGEADTSPVVKGFLDRWKSAHGGALPGTTMAALGYDAMALTLDALGRAKGLDSKNLIDAINDTENFHGVSGDITLKGYNGNPPKKALVVKVNPMDPKTGEWQKFAIAYEPKDVQDALAKAGSKP